MIEFASHVSRFAAPVSLRVARSTWKAAAVLTTWVEKVVTGPSGSDVVRLRSSAYFSLAALRAWAMEA
jgi:hypothetical protein